MNLNDILLLGDPRLYETCRPVAQEELPELHAVVEDMAGIVAAFRA